MPELCEYARAYRLFSNKSSASDSNSTALLWATAHKWRNKFSEFDMVNSWYRTEEPNTRVPVSLFRIRRRSYRLLLRLGAMSLAGRTTYMLGAGASFHAGYPFARMMGRELLDWMKQAEPCFYDFAESARFLELEFGSNIEVMMNGMQKAITHRTPGYSLIANCHKPAFVESLRQWFGGIHRQRNARAYEVFASEIVQSGGQRRILFLY